MNARRANRPLAWTGAAALVLAALLALGATQIRGEAGYAGAGPSFLPWLMSAAMALCGALLVVVAWRSSEVLVPAIDFPPRWQAVAWISAGLLLNAVLIERIGFIASCAVLFALAARGLRIGEDKRPAWSSVGVDALIGAAISAPVFWLFTKVLKLTLPALTSGGWI